MDGRRIFSGKKEHQRVFWHIFRKKYFSNILANYAKDPVVTLNFINFTLETSRAAKVMQ